MRASSQRLSTVRRGVGLRVGSGVGPWVGPWVGTASCCRPAFALVIGAALLLALPTSLGDLELGT